MLIFGFGPGKAKDLGPVVWATCMSCGNEVAFHHVQSKRSFRLYFVPVVPYGTDDYLLCPVCSRGVQLDATRLEAVAPMQDLTARFDAGLVSRVVYAEQSAAFLQQVGLASADTAPDDSVAGPERSWAAQLEDLERLHAEGVLDDAQYEAARAKLLGT